MAEHNTRLQNWLAIFVIIGSTFYCFNGNVQKMWPTKVKFEWPLGKIGLKMASGQLLYCALDGICILEIVRFLAQKIIQKPAKFFTCWQFGSLGGKPKIVFRFIAVSSYEVFKNWCLQICITQQRKRLYNCFLHLIALLHPKTCLLPITAAPVLAWWFTVYFYSSLCSISFSSMLQRWQLAVCTLWL